MKILIVDDSRIMRMIVKNSLLKQKRHEYDFFEADNGVDAFNILESTSVDLVLLDWNMPQLSGLDLMKELRVLPRYAELPIIMITSEAAKYNVIEAVKAGVNDYMIKPVDDKKLIEKIEQVLKIRR